MKMKVTTDIQPGTSGWTASEAAEMPQGTVTDTVNLERESLIVLKRNIKRGPVAIDLDFAGNKAKGKLNMNGEDKPIAADLGGPLFADGAGTDQVIACLPLAEGYSTMFRNFDVQTQKEKLMQLTVAGKEEVTVPAGTFQTLRVEVSSADGGSDKRTVWIAPDTHKMVKMSAVLASMGGATMTEELMQ
jgi:hypothetical protein